MTTSTGDVAAADRRHAAIKRLDMNLQERFPAHHHQPDPGLPVADHRHLGADRRVQQPGRRPAGGDGSHLSDPGLHRLREPAAELGRRGADPAVGGALHRRYQGAHPRHSHRWRHRRRFVLGSVILFSPVTPSAPSMPTGVSVPWPWIALMTTLSVVVFTVAVGAGLGRRRRR